MEREKAAVGAVLFVDDHANVVRFYTEALGLERVYGDRDHSVLNCRGFDLTIHQISTRSPSENPSPRRREGAPLRLDFPVENIEAARAVAVRLGGKVDDGPPAWAPPTAGFRLGHDPEGNVFRIVEARRSNR